MITTATGARMQIGDGKGGWTDLPCAMTEPEYLDVTTFEDAGRFEVQMAVRAREGDPWQWRHRLAPVSYCPPPPWWPGPPPRAA